MQTYTTLWNEPHCRFTVEHKRKTALEGYPEPQYQLDSSFLNRDDAFAMAKEDFDVWGDVSYIRVRDAENPDVLWIVWPNSAGEPTMDRIDILTGEITADPV